MVWLSDLAVSEAARSGQVLGHKSLASVTISSCERVDPRAPIKCIQCVVTTLYVSISCSRDSCAGFANVHFLALKKQKRPQMLKYTTCIVCLI